MIIVVAIALIAQASPSSIPKRPLYSADGQKVECRLILEVHSRVPSRICRTEAEWARIAKETESDLTNSRNDRTLGCKGLLGC